MGNHRRSILLVVYGAVFTAALVALPSRASGHTDPCHTDHTCPSDVTPPDYACGDNPSGVCSAPNSPDVTQPNAAPVLGGPPSAADCGSFETFYTGAVCRQALALPSPSPSPIGSLAPGASAVPSASAAASPTILTTPTPTVLPSGLLDPNIGIGVPSGGDDALGTTLIAFWALMLAGGAFVVVSMWRIFDKAGEPGWAAIVPIYNLLVYVKIARRPWWWILISWLVVPWFIVNIDLAKAFRRSTEFGVGLTLVPFVFLPILAFGPARYRYRPREAGGPQPLR